MYTLSFHDMTDDQWRWFERSLDPDQITIDPPESLSEWPDDLTDEEWADYLGELYDDPVD